MITPKDLSQKLELIGLSPGKYQTDELRDRLGKVIVFPSYAMKKFFIPPLLMAIFLIIGTVLLYYYGHWLAGTVSLLMGFVTVLTAGMAWGAYNFSSSVTDDLEAISGISLEIAEGLSRDLKEIGTTVGIAMEQRPGYADILAATNTLVVIPIASGLVKDKVPLLGGMAARIVRKMLLAGQRAVLKMIKGRQKQAPAQNAGEDSIDAYCDGIIKFAQESREYIVKVADKTRKTVVAPQKAMLITFLVIHALAYTLLLYFTFG